MSDRDVRTHELIPQTIRVHIELEVVTEQDLTKGFLTVFGDDLADMVTKRLKSTAGVTHLRTKEWDVSVQ